MEFLDVEGQFLPPDSINTLAPAAAEVPDDILFFARTAHETFN